MADHVRVDLGDLDRLLTSMRESYVPLGAVRYTHNRLHGFPKTQGALQEYHGKWDLRRQELLDGLGALTDALQQVRDTFHDLDVSLDTSLGDKR